MLVSHSHRQARSRSTWCALALASVVAGFSGCSVPCDSEQDCFEDQFCAEDGVCAKECSVDADCEGGERCSLRGECRGSLAPVAAFVLPAADAAVGDLFDVEVDVTFRGDLATVRLERDASNVGGICGPFAPQEVILTGDVAQEVTQRVVFRDIQPYARFFSLRVVAEANGLRGTIARGFSGDPGDDFGGAKISEPAEAIVRTNVLTSKLSATFEPQAAVVSAWVEPERGAPSPRVLLAQNTGAIEGVSIPVARGRQTVWVETERQGVTSICGRSFTVDPLEESRGLGVALAFESEGDAELDLWIFAERDGYDAEICTVENPRNLCRGGDQSSPFQTVGEERLRLDLDSGVYGIAVAPAIISEPVSARVRLSTNGVHLGWLGPRRVFAEDGAVWLAARVYVLDGAVSIEPLETMTVGLPSGTVSDW